MKMVRAIFLFSMLVFPPTVIGAYAQPKSLVIGIDGMGFGEQGFSVANTPNIDALINGTWQTGYNGAYTDKAFAGGVIGEPTEQPTSSIPGWNTILRGVWANQHGLYDSTGTLNPGFPFYLSTLGVNVAGLYSTNVNITSAADATALATNIGAIATNVPMAVYSQQPNVDAAGHVCGSNGTCFSDAITEADGFVGQLLDAVANRPNFAMEDWQIIVMADHGHLPDAQGHGGQSDVERNVPLIVSSKSITQGGILANSYGVAIVDIAPTVLEHFNVSIPSYYAGNPVAGVAVPEPSSALLASFAALIVACRSVRRLRG